MSRFTITATLKEVYELTYSNYVMGDEEAIEKTEAFFSVASAKEYVDRNHVYVVSFCKVTDCKELLEG